MTEKVSKANQLNRISFDVRDQIATAFLQEYYACNLFFNAFLPILAYHR